MRLLVTLLILLTGIISGAFWINYSLQMSTNELAEQIVIVNKEIKNDSWEMALSKMEETEDKWKEKTRWWPIFLNHEEMDVIEFSLAKAKAYVHAENEALALGQLSELKRMLEHIHEKEQLNIENIL